MFYAMLEKRAQRALLLLSFSIFAGCATQHHGIHSTSTPVENQVFDREKFLAAKTSYYSGELKQSENLFLKISKESPNFSEAYFFLANIYFSQDDLKSARAMYYACLKLDPDHVFALFNVTVLETVMSHKRLMQVEALLPDEHPISKTTQNYKALLAKALEQTTIASNKL